MKFNLEDFNNKNITINCETKEEVEKLEKIFKECKVDIKECKVDVFDMRNGWLTYSTDVCYCIIYNKMYYANLDFYKNQNYKIIKFDELEFEGDNMNKKLKFCELELKENKVYKCFYDDTFVLFRVVDGKLILQGTNEDIDILDYFGSTKKLLKAEFEEVNVNKSDKWNIKYGDEYYYINEIGNIRYNNNDGKYYDKKIIQNANACKDKEYMERESFETNLRRKLKRFADVNNDKEINWSNNKFKCHISCNHHYNEIHVSASYSDTFGQVYFTSRNICLKAIEEFREELEEYFGLKEN